MEEADRRLLYYLDLNSRCPVKRLAGLTGLRPEKVEERLVGFRKEGIILRCFPEINRSKLGFYPFKVYLQLQRATPEKVREMYDYLAALPNSGWVVLCSGKWDMIFSIWSRSVSDFNRIFEEFFFKYHDYILSKVTTNTVESILTNKKWLCEELGERKIGKTGGFPKSIVDDADQRILHCVGKDCRKPVLRIAEELGMEPNDVDARLRRMQKDGVILSFRVDLDMKALERSFCKSFVYMTKSSKKDEERLVDYCLRHPEITAIVKTVGPWDFEIEAQSTSFHKFTEMMNDIRNRYSSLVRNFEAVVIYKETGMMYAPKSIS
jgi:DNA-binding Lrp family transcriptional regulator